MLEKLIEGEIIADIIKIRFIFFNYAVIEYNLEVENVSRKPVIFLPLMYQKKSIH